MYYRHVTKNFCGLAHCEYSHDPTVIAIARDKQMADLTNAKREMQAGHQAVMKTFDKQGSKVFKQGATIIERRPLNPELAPHISLLIQSSDPPLDQHIGREHECYQGIALCPSGFLATSSVMDARLRSSYFARRC